MKSIPAKRCWGQLAGRDPRNAGTGCIRQNRFSAPAAKTILTAVLCCFFAFNGIAAAGPASADWARGLNEKLTFAIEWRPPWYLFFLPQMEAGEGNLSITGETEYEQNRAYKIVFSARSSGTLVKLAGIKIDDRFEFITDATTFCTYAASKKEREGKRKRDIDVVYLREEKRLHIRELDMAFDPPLVKKDLYKENIPECVRDLFSAFYFMRGHDFYPGARYRSVVGDNDRVKEVEIQVEKAETVQTPAGSFKAWKINTVALVGGLFKDGGQFRMWLTADEKRVPIQFEAKVNLGTVIGRLKSVTY
jgi:hypothetical protein